ncbi:MAG: glycosyltransferase family 2 protein [Candidatus Methanofastidiosia archaeon]
MTCNNGQMNEPGASRKVSVVVSSYTMDRSDDMISALKSLFDQTYQDLEIIVVVDEDYVLYTELLKFTGKVESSKEVKVVYNQNGWGLSSGRNRGIEVSSGSIVAFIDDDAIASPQWIENLVAVYKKYDDAGCVTGKIEPLWMEIDCSWLPTCFYWLISCTYRDMHEECEVRNGFGTNISFRRTVFNEIGLFLTDLGKCKGKGLLSEEMELCLRLRERTNRKVIYTPEAVVQHKVYPFRVTLRALARRAFHDGLSKALINRMYRKSRPLETEFSLLNHLLVVFYPQCVVGLFREPSLYARQLVATALIVLSEALGFSYGMLFKIKQ